VKLSLTDKIPAQQSTLCSKKVTPKFKSL